MFSYIIAWPESWPSTPLFCYFFVPHTMSSKSCSNCFSIWRNCTLFDSSLVFRNRKTCGDQSPKPQVDSNLLKSSPDPHTRFRIGQVTPQKFLETYFLALSSIFQAPLNIFFLRLSCFSEHISCTIEHDKRNVLCFSCIEHNMASLVVWQKSLPLPSRTCGRSGACISDGSI